MMMASSADEAQADGTRLGNEDRLSFCSALNTPTGTELSNIVMNDKLKSLEQTIANLMQTVQCMAEKQTEMENELRDKQRVIDTQNQKLRARKHPGKRERQLAARSASVSESEQGTPSSGSLPQEIVDQAERQQMKVLGEAPLRTEQQGQEAEAQLQAQRRMEESEAHHRAEAHREAGDEGEPEQFPLSQAAVSSQAPKENEPTIGTAVEVFSTQTQRWELGRITNANGRMVVVEYAPLAIKFHLDDPGHLAAFRWVKDQAAAQAVLGRGPVGGRGEKRLYSVGDFIAVFSESKNQWLEGKVAELTDVEMVVAYGDRMRIINLQSEDYSDFVRPLAVEVFSTDTQGWELGRIANTNGRMVVVEYAPRAGKFDLDDPGHLAAFRLVEDQAAAQAALGRRPVGVGEKKLYRVGEAIKVFSKSKNQWLEGKVAKLTDVEMVVAYGDRMRIINLQSEDHSGLVRPLEVEALHRAVELLQQERLRRQTPHLCEILIDFLGCLNCLSFFL